MLPFGCCGASKRFGKVVALDDAWLTIRRGEFMTLLGPSGCGKTTLLNLVAGFLAPMKARSSSTVRGSTDVPTYKRKIGMVFQNYALFPHMSIANNVAYGLKMRGIAKADLKRRVAEVLSLCSLTGVEDRRPQQLSGGQQQRVALARALAYPRRCCCWTNRFLRSTRICAPRCRSRSRKSSASSASPRFS